jgi:hypothetical protein
VAALCIALIVLPYVASVALASMALLCVFDGPAMYGFDSFVCGFDSAVISVFDALLHIASMALSIVLLSISLMRCYK